MASIARRDDGRWRARYRDPAGREHARHFTRKVDAQRWLDDVVTAVNTGAWVDPARAQVTVAEWAKEWLEGQSHLKPSSWERYAGILRAHVLPAWGERRIADITHAEIQRWVTGLTLESSPSTVHKIHRTLSLVLKLAVKDGRLARNPADGVNLPRIVETEHVYLTHDQVDELAQRCSPHRLTVLFLAYTGVRFGEMAALRVRRLDLKRRRATIAESVTLVRGERVWGTPKGHERRAVPIPRFLVDELAENIAGMGPEDLVFPGVRGGPLRAQSFQRTVLTDAASAMGLPGFHPHLLRHTAASLAIAAGANVKVVQSMLGHKTATMTLDLYGHLFADQLDEVADALDAARQRGLSADFLRTDRCIDGQSQVEAGASVPAETGPIAKYPQRDSNPCYRLERAAS